MKKLMIIAAVASLAVGAEALTVRHCTNPRSYTCPVVAFKVTASGKIAAPVEYKKGDYKTAAKLQIKKGALVIFATQGTPEVKQSGVKTVDTCCYEAYSLYLKAKVNKEEYPVGVFFQPLDSWTIFGKNYNKILGAYGEKSKKGKVESEIGLSYAVSSGSYGNGINTTDALGVGAGTDTVTGGTGLDIDLGLQDFAFIATAFGKGSYNYSYYESDSHCAVCVEEGEVFTPSSYSGWFAGLIEQLGDEQGCLMCDCYSLDVFGGTWKAKYEKGWSKNANGWQSAASYVFGSGTLNLMLRGGDPQGDPKDQSNWIE